MTAKFFGLFDSHAKLILDGSVALADVLRHCDNGTDRITGLTLIEDAERAADRITHETVQLLHSTFVTRGASRRPATKESGARCAALLRRRLPFR